MERKYFSTPLALLSAGVLGVGAASGLADETAAMPMHHHHMASQMTASTVPYQVPNLTLVRADGETVSLPAEMNDGRPVLLNFIYTSCTSVCPLMSQMFSQFQAQLGAEELDKIHLMSISIDPEADTPAKLTDYAKSYGAGREWQFYTGTVNASVAAQRAFDVYHGDKMSHTVVTLIRAKPGEPWRRLDGFVTPDELMAEYRQVLATK
jgi:protein SCO1